MTTVKLNFEICDEGCNATEADIWDAAKKLTDSLLFMIHAFGADRVTVKIVRDDGDE